MPVSVHILCSFLLSFCSLLIDPTVYGAQVTTRTYRYYPRRYQHFAVYYDDGSPFSKRDFGVMLDMVAALAYLGYSPVFMQPEANSICNANNVICQNEECYIEASKQNHIELRRGDFSILHNTALRGPFISNMNISFTFGLQAIPTKPSDGLEFSSYVCLHPCIVSIPNNATASVEAIKTAGGYSLIIVQSEYSREKLLFDLHSHIITAGAYGVSLPVVKPVRQPIPDDLTFQRDLHRSEQSKETFRVCTANIKISTDWYQVLVKVIKVYNNLCHIYFENSVCELVFMTEWGSAINNFVLSRLMDIVRTMATLKLRIISNVTDTNIQQQIIDCDQYLAIPDAPRVLRAIKTGQKFGYHPKKLIDPYALFSFLHGIPAIHLDVGSAQELMPSSKYRTRNILVVESIEELQRSSGFIIKKMSQSAKGQSFLRHATRKVAAIGIKSVVSVLGKVMQKFPFVAKYDSFVKKNIKYLRKFSLSADPTAPNVALCIDPGLNPSIEFSVRNILLHLRSSWALVMFHSLENELYMKYLLRDISGVIYLPIESNFTTRRGFSKWIKTPVVWKKLLDMNFKHALLFQADSIMLRGDIDSFLKYDYVGAPWCRNAMASINTINGVGNGGFSLRNISAMLQISESYMESHNSAELEDVFFVSRMEALPDLYKLPPKNVAYDFAIEVFCEDEFPLHISKAPKLKLVEYNKKRAVTAVPPLALHAAWLFAWEVNRTEIVDEWIRLYFDKMADEII